MHHPETSAALKTKSIKCLPEKAQRSWFGAYLRNSVNTKKTLQSNSKKLCEFLFIKSDVLCQTDWYVSPLAHWICHPKFLQKSSAGKAVTSLTLSFSSYLCLLLESSLTSTTFLSEHGQQLSKFEISATLNWVPTSNKRHMWGAKKTNKHCSAHSS